MPRLHPSMMAYIIQGVDGMRVEKTRAKKKKKKKRHEARKLHKKHEQDGKNALKRMTRIFIHRCVRVTVSSSHFLCVLFLAHGSCSRSQCVLQEHARTYTLHGLYVEHLLILMPSINWMRA